MAKKNNDIKSSGNIKHSDEKKVKNNGDEKIIDKNTKKNKAKSKTIETKKTLVIVESPAKAKTINKYLGNKYKVVASMGHIIDLPKSRLAIDVENDFKAEFITVRGKTEILNNLKKEASKSDLVLLASDNDREGEAIAYNIGEALHKKYPDIPIKRIVFNEITKNAILDSIKKPGVIDQTKVDAQKTRRILDRLVGYNISPILWKKVKSGLSAGRVQSVTLKVICEREIEIGNFISKEYWTLEAIFSKNKKEFVAELYKVGDDKKEFNSKDEIDSIISRLDKNNFIVVNINKSKKSMRPLAPFTTSKLQQTAANRLNFVSKKTMKIAQELYEGIDVGSETVGLITYMRTDSTRISPLAIAEVREFIGEEFPKNLPGSPNYFSKSSNAQDAHEAIRPTSVYRTPASIKKYLTNDQFKLYSIIWERFVSSQMTNAEYLITTITIQNDDVVFRASNSNIIDEGYYKVLDLLKSKENEEKKSKLPDLIENEKVNLSKYIPEQHFTEPPPRYTDASIIKFLEENGIGRPSTYAPTISTILDRYYVVRKNKQLVPTVLGNLVNEIMIKSFPDIVSVSFTADMEKDLDEIENKNKNPTTLLREFYDPFKIVLDEAMINLKDQKRAFEEETGELCEKCGRPFVKKLSRNGFFIACSGFPECRNSKPLPLGKCPKCNTGKIIEKKTQRNRGKIFYGCTNYPNCDFVSYYKPTETICPKCGKYMINKSSKSEGSYKVCIDEKCGYKLIE